MSEAPPRTLPLAAASARLRGRPGRPRKPQSALAPQASVTFASRLLSARDTALYLGVGYETVLDLVKAGTLRPVRVPLARGELRKLLFDRPDLDRLIETWKSP